MVTWYENFAKYDLGKSKVNSYNLAVPNYFTQKNNKSEARALLTWILKLRHGESGYVKGVKYRMLL